MIDDASGWREAHDLIRAYVRRRVPAPDVDDVTGEILLRAVRYRDSLVAASNPAAWLRRVAASQVAEYYRRHATTPPPGWDAPADDEAEQAKDATDCLIPMIERLSPIYAQAVRLVDHQGMSVADAAREAGISLSAMKSRLRRGREMLRTRFLQCCRVELDRRGAVMEIEPRRPRQACCG